MPRPISSIRLSDSDREKLELMASRPKSSQRDSLVSAQQMGVGRIWPPEHR